MAHGDELIGGKPLEGSRTLDGRVQFLESKFLNTDSSLERDAPMPGFLDNAEVEIPCPKCGKKTKERLGRLKNNPVLHCAGCGTEIQVNANGPGGLAQGMKSVDKSLADLKRSLGKLAR